MGFGNRTGEFWMGLDCLHNMTTRFLLVNERRYEMKIELEDFHGNTSYALYQEFWISSEEEGYQLFISNYNGTAEDSLTQTGNSAKFSTSDQAGRRHQASGNSPTNFPHLHLVFFRLVFPVPWYSSPTWNGLTTWYSPSPDILFPLAVPPPCDPKVLGGGWWRKDCTESNLNGMYLGNTDSLSGI